jgi:putative FmdB family regulatory protein
MPIYEFYCSDCNTLFNFFARSVDTKTRPMCPRCRKHKLERQVSLFAAGGGGRKGEGTADEAADLPIDESRMEAAVNQLASEVEGIGDDDPRQAAKLMRKFSKLSGMKFGERIEEAIGRMEAGEDPDQIEQEIGGDPDENEPILFEGKKSKGGASLRGQAPRRDPTLYEM